MPNKILYPTARKSSESYVHPKNRCPSQYPPQPTGQNATKTGPIVPTLLGRATNFTITKNYGMANISATTVGLVTADL